MKKLKSIALGLAAAALIAGCANFSTNTFRAEQTATGLAYTAYIGYTQGLANGTIKVDAGTSNQIRTARLKFAATVSTIESLRVAYATNSALQGQITGLLSTLADQSSNLVWTISFVKGP